MGDLFSKTETRLSEAREELRKLWREVYKLQGVAHDKKRDDLVKTLQHTSGVVLTLLEDFDSVVEAWLKRVDEIAKTLAQVKAELGLPTVANELGIETTSPTLKPAPAKIEVDGAQVSVNLSPRQQAILTTLAQNPASFEAEGPLVLINKALPQGVAVAGKNLPAEEYYRRHYNPDITQLLAKYAFWLKSADKTVFSRATTTVFQSIRERIGGSQQLEALFVEINKKK